MSSSYSNVTIPNPEVAFQENINKILYDQSVLLQPTISYMDAYALMPTDNSGSIVATANIQFPRTNSFSSIDISRLSVSTFNLGPIGVYDVFFQVGVSGLGQCVVTLNNIEQPFTLVGTSNNDISGNPITTGNVITGRSLLTTVSNNTVLALRNPTGDSSLVIASALGGNAPVSAHLIITRIR